MSHVESASSHNPREEGTPLIHTLGYAKCPVCKFATIYSGSKHEEFVVLLERTAVYLRKYKDKEARLIREALNEYLLTQ
jgi:hypothetical protein